MELTQKQIVNIEAVLKESLRNKFQNYNPEPATMPFHTRLLGKDRMASFSFIHSLNTNFGITIFEPVAKELAKTKFKIIKSQTSVGNQISEVAQRVIQNSMDGLTTAQIQPNKIQEIEAIRKVCREGDMRTIKPTKVDIFLQSHQDECF